MALPRCEPSGRLGFHLVERLGDLRSGHYGVLEPPASLPALASASLPLVLVPGVAFDLSGRRLGRGRGYYDKTFATAVRGQLLFGVGYALQLVAHVPSGPMDRWLDAVVSELELRAVKM